MDTGARFLDCPAYMDRNGMERCGLLAAVEDSYMARSMEGPLESVRIRCPCGHWFNGSTDSLTWAKNPSAAVQHNQHWPSTVLPTGKGVAH